VHKLISDAFFRPGLLLSVSHLLRLAGNNHQQQLYGGARVPYLQHRIASHQVEQKRRRSDLLPSSSHPPDRFFSLGSRQQAAGEIDRSADPSIDPWVVFSKVSTGGQAMQAARCARQSD